MLDDKQRDWQDALDRRRREMIDGAFADEEFMAATREGVAASLRGDKGIPVREVQEEARRREGR